MEAVGPKSARDDPQWKTFFSLQLHAQSRVEAATVAFVGDCLEDAPVLLLHALLEVPGVLACIDTTPAAFQQLHVLRGCSATGTKRGKQTRINKNLTAIVYQCAKGLPESPCVSIGALTVKSADEIQTWQWWRRVFLRQEPPAGKIHV